MKTATVLVGLLWISATPLLACDKGCTEYQGMCACDAKPETAPIVIPSNEKPPRSGRPSYENPSIHADMPLTQISKDAGISERLLISKDPSKYN